MNQDIARILITEEELQNRIAELAKTVSADAEGIAGLMHELISDHTLG